MKYFDAHCHVQFEQYDPDRDTLIKEMQKQEIGGLVVGCNAASSRKAAELATDHEHLFAAVGIHPNYIEEEAYDEHLLRNLMMYPKVVAVGECGLDYFRPREVTEEVKAKQKEVFKKHARLSGATNRPLIIHSRPSKGSMDAYHDLIDILKEVKAEFPQVKGDVHFFVGGVEEANALVELGFTLSFTAVITFARDYDEVIRRIPLTSILSETDAPYVAPASRRGQRNDSLSIPEVVTKIAEIRGEDIETVRTTLIENAEKMFDLEVI